MYWSGGEGDSVRPHIPGLRLAHLERAPGGVRQACGCVLPEVRMG